MFDTSISTNGEGSQASFVFITAEQLRECAARRRLTVQQTVYGDAAIVRLRHVCLAHNQAHSVRYLEASVTLDVEDCFTIIVAIDSEPFLRFVVGANTVSYSCGEHIEIVCGFDRIESLMREACERVRCAGVED